MHAVFFVLNDIKISLAEDSNTFSRDYIIIIIIIIIIIYLHQTT